jgi:cell cycle sensor histidine kinase DivJ
VGLLKPIRDYIDTLVHSSARHEVLVASRHRAFIAPRLFGSFVALAALPVYVVARSVPGTLEVLVFAWLLLPILIAYYLSRSGDYERAHILSSLALTVLGTVVAANTGGIHSFAVIWLVIVPLEAALSASRRVVAVAATVALSAAALLLVLGMRNLLPSPGAAGNDAGALASLGVVSALLYATGLALGAVSLARASNGLLYAEEDRYRLLARNMTDVITRHSRNGAVTFSSPAAVTLFGAPVSEILGHRLFDRVHVADRPAYLTALADATSLKEPRSVEFRVRRDLLDNETTEPSGQVRFIWVEMRCRPLDAAAGVTGADAEVVAVMRDVTERKMQERALEEAHAEADRANAAKVKFLANMSHELRTPLNAIIGFSDLLITEDKMRLGVKQRQEYARLINDSGTHLLSVVNGMLDASKMESGDFEVSPECFAPAPVIGNCCDLLMLKARDAGIELALQLPDRMPDIVADKRAFRQILINLISNAVKFTDSGGQVMVSAKAEAGALLVTVRDTGVGISAEDLPQVGRPFFQARATYDRRHDGTGLGLSIVRGLVELHGGRMNIASRLGEGTCVTVGLPIDCEIVRPRRERAALAHQTFDRISAPDSVPFRKTA